MISISDQVTSVANTMLLVSLFRIEGNVKFQFEVNETKDVTFSWT